MSRRRVYIIISWADLRLERRGRRPATREYGTASSKQAAIRRAERVLPPDTEYIIRAASTTVHTGRTPDTTRGTDAPRRRS